MNIFKENSEPNIFEFGIDETGKAYLLQTARWTMFLAVMGFIFTGLMFLLAFIFIAGPLKGMLAASMPGMQSTLFAVYIFLGLLYLYPTVELFLFSSAVKKSMASAEVSLFNKAMKHQRNMFRFMGIIVIALLLIYGLAIAIIALKAI